MPATYTKHSIWIYDVTHFAGCPRVAVITIMDLVTRKWICEVVSGEETGTQIQAAFCDALELEGLDELVAERQDSLADPPSLPPSVMPFVGRSCWPSATTGRR